MSMTEVANPTHAIRDIEEAKTCLAEIEDPLHRATTQIGPGGEDKPGKPSKFS